MRTLPVIASSVLAAFAAGCASSPASSSSRPVYTTNELGTVKSEVKGEILGMREVLVQAPSREAGSTGAGATLGAAAVTGAILNSPTTVGRALGNIAGGAMGAKADDKIADEITVRLDTGETRVIVQERGKEILVPGQRVKMIIGSASVRGSSRVVADEDPRSMPDVVGRKY